MSQLVAKCNILYANRTYKAGDALPGADPALVDAWIRAGTAEFITDLPEGPFSADIGAAKLRAAGKEFGLNFGVGIKNADMADALNAAYAEKLAADRAAEKIAAKAKEDAEAELKADLVARMQAVPYAIATEYFNFPNGEETPIEEVKEAVEKAEAKADEEEAARKSAEGGGSGAGEKPKGEGDPL